MLHRRGVAGWPEDSQKAHAGHECGNGTMQVPLIVDLGGPGNLQLIPNGGDFAESSFKGQLQIRQASIRQRLELLMYMCLKVTADAAASYARRHFDSVISGRQEQLNPGLTRIIDRPTGTQRMVDISAILAVFQACSWSETFGPAICLLAKPLPKKTASAVEDTKLTACL